LLFKARMETQSQAQQNQGLADIRAIMAQRHQAHLAKLQQEADAKREAFIREAKKLIGSQLFYAVKHTARWARQLVQAQRLARAYLLRHKDRLAANRLAASLEAETAQTIRDQQNLEYIACLAKDKNPKRMRLMAAINSFLEMNQFSHDIPPYEEIWQTEVSTTLALKPDLIYPEEIALRRVWVISHPNEEMVKLIGNEIIQLEKTNWVELAKAKCQLRQPSPLPCPSQVETDEEDLLDDFPSPPASPQPLQDEPASQAETNEVALCLQCSDPAGDFFIGDMQFCEHCFLGLNA
jgi:hypothetical protein